MLPWRPGAWLFPDRPAGRSRRWTGRFSRALPGHAGQRPGPARAVQWRWPVGADGPAGQGGARGGCAGGAWCYLLKGGRAAPNRPHHRVTIGIILSLRRQFGSWYSRTAAAPNPKAFPWTGAERSGSVSPRPAGRRIFNDNQTPPLLKPSHGQHGMNQELSLHHRRRQPTPDELAGIPWLPLLQPVERERAMVALLVGDARAGDYVCRIGRPVTYWFGVIEGLLKMSNDNADGGTMTFAGLPPGGGFGEGTVVKREPYRYNVQALRKSVVAGLPIETFHWLLDHSIGFNRYVMNQLNERLGQFIAAREIHRLNNPDARVARSLAALFNSALYPGVGEVLRITQQELAYLVGLSRQRVNEALAALEAQGAIRVEYGGLRVLDLAALRSSVMQ